MKPESLDSLRRRARNAPRARSEEVPPFFAQRITARWLAASRTNEESPWEMFALRGVAISAAAMILAVALSASLLPGNNDESELDYTAEVFSLP
jgi:DNA-binding PucR family transcriptional regulator